MVAETPLSLPSLTLLATGSLALALSLLFRLKSCAVNDLPKNLSANIFTRTFNIFNPYPDRRKMIHRFLAALPVVIFLVCAGFAFLFIKILQSGILLTVIVLIVCLNLIVMEEASDVYSNASLFVKAIQDDDDMGEGDLRIFEIIKNALPKISNYYLLLAIMFLLSAMILPYVMPSTIRVFAHFLGLIVEGGALTGFLAPLTAVLLFSISTVIAQITVRKVRARFSKYLLQSPTE